MGIQDEISGRLKMYLLIFVFLLIGTMSYFVISQNQVIGQIYAAASDTSVIPHHKFLPTANVDTVPTNP